MGTQQSKSDKEKYSKDHVQRMLERQRRMFEQQQIQKNAAAAAAVAEQARFERNRTPYSFTQNDIHIGVSQPTKTSLYPNLETYATTASPSHNPTATYHSPPPTSYHPLENINAINNNTNIGTQSSVTPTAPQAPARAPQPHFRNSRSTSRPRSQARRDRDLNEELNCPTCHQKYTSKIYQCNSGHSSCSDCKNRFMCGICGQRIGDVRNITLESFIGERKVNCPNAQDGCKLIFKMAELEIHEKECPFQEMRCPLAAIFGQCQWRGKLPQIWKHFEEAHPIHCGEVNKELTVTRNEKQIVYLVIIGSFNFLFSLKVSELDKKIYMTVQLIDTKHSAEKWSYEVHVYNKNQPLRKYRYSDICHSNYTPLNEIFTAEQCATLPLAYAESFVNRDLLTYKFFIKKTSKVNLGTNGKVVPDVAINTFTKQTKNSDR